MAHPHPADQTTQVGPLATPKGPQEDQPDNPDRKGPSARLGEPGQLQLADPQHDDSKIFPALHIRPQSGWVNDPNGLSRFGGRYHVFFQYNPAAPLPENICWGHASSTDLVHWREEPVALIPRPGEVDAFGCWSGCIVDDHGTPTAVYTAVREVPADAWATVARGSADLQTWIQGPEVAPTPETPAIGQLRDPFVFYHEGLAGRHRFVIQGGGQPEPGGRPQLLLYGADDLEAWEPLGPILTDDDPIAARIAPANIWECPNLFPMEDQWILIVSLWRFDADLGHMLSGVRYLVGNLEETATGTVPGLRFAPKSGGLLDHGPALYAPQILLDDDRVLLWGWSWELGRTADQVAQSGWAGSLTFPRELRLLNGQLINEPAAELVALRQVDLGQLDVIQGESAIEIVSERPIGLSLHTPGGAQIVINVDHFQTGPIRILIDHSIIEAFGDGRSFTTRAYPTADSQWMLTERAQIYRLGL